VIQSARVEKQKKNKDGSIAKRPEVWHRCNLCKELVKKINLDHVSPVVALDKSYSDYTLDEYVKRLDCKIDNLQVLCVDCHKKKTAEERKQRRQAKCQ